MDGWKRVLLVGMALAGAAGAEALPEGYPATPRTRESINMGWKFHLGDPDAEFFAQDFDDAAWETVHLPHTLHLTSLGLDGCEDDKFQETFMREVGWYRRNLRVSAEPGKKVFLEFEGAHQATDAWVNGRHVGRFDVGGYSPFHFDITAFVVRGAANQLTLRVDNRKSEVIPPDPGPFDYIKFGGLYRDVYLVETDPLHVTFPWEAPDAGVHATTPTVDPVNLNGVVRVRTTVRNEYDEPCEATLTTRVVDREGVVVLRLVDAQTVDPGREATFDQIGSIEEDLRLWTLDDPYLYRVNSLVAVAGRPVDCVENRIGFRKVEITNRDGLLLNGEPVKLVGMNRHQHYGYIGDALPNALHFKDVLQLKRLGMNVLRTAHYPQDDALIDACDELGLLVYEEAPTWITISTNSVWFDHLEQAARIMVRNHRNHPSIIVWGAGINHRGPVARIHNACKQEDPTRFTASQGSRWTGWQTSGITDIYAQMVYGPYYWSEEEPVLAMEGGRGPEAVNEVLDHPMKLGLISWTAHAYYTFHPSKDPLDRSRGGMTTLFRWPKPGTAWYPSERLPEPFTHIDSEWREGVETVEVYSNADEVELLLDGRPYKRGGPCREAGFEHLKHPPFRFAIDDFRPGTLTANGLVNGQVVSSATIRTPGAPTAVRLHLDIGERPVMADGADIVVAHAEVVDAQGTVITDPSCAVAFAVEGPASIVGDGAGIGANPALVRHGAAPVLVRAGTEPGRVVLHAAVEGLEPAQAEFGTVPFQPDRIAAAALPIHDLERMRIDIGGNTQLLQFGWIPWSADDNAASTRTFAELGGFTATLRCAENDDLLRWLGEMNVMGRNGFAYGDGVLCMDPKGLVLELAGLPTGRYRIVTGHHAPRNNTDSMDPNPEKKRTAEIYKLPYARQIAIEAGSGICTVDVTEGEAMHREPFASRAIVVESDGRTPVVVNFRDASGQGRGVWLNLLEIGQWL